MIQSRLATTTSLSLSHIHSLFLSFSFTLSDSVSHPPHSHIAAPCPANCKTGCDASGRCKDCKSRFFGPKCDNGTHSRDEPQRGLMKNTHTHTHSLLSLSLSLSLSLLPKQSLAQGRDSNSRALEVFLTRSVSPIQCTHSSCPILRVL